MKKVILIRYGEILLKGLNRSSFENKLISNIKRSVHKLGKVTVRKSQARIYIEPEEENYNFDEAIQLLSKVFGIVSVSPVWKIDTDYNTIKEYSVKMVRDLVERKGYSTFRWRLKEETSSFMDSPEISRDLGAHVLRNVPVDVDVKNHFILYVEVILPIFIQKYPAVCGMPLGPMVRPFYCLEVSTVRLPAGC